MDNAKKIKINLIIFFFLYLSLLFGFVVGEDSLGGAKIDFEKILKKVSDFNYNALVDLNRSIEQPLSLLCMRLDIPIRVGFSSPISNYLYTVVIDPSENSFLEDNYITIEKILGLSQ